MLLCPDVLPEKRLKLRFESVDTAELQNVEITFEGDRAIFKIGEGESNHYQIPNDKKLWETQFMIINQGGQYYIRDLGFVHTSRVKLDKRAEIQIQKGSIVDLGKVVHYHFDKATHQSIPAMTPSESFYLMRPADKKYDIDEEDFPHLRARPTWVSADENVDNIQNEINVYSDGQKLIHSLGRSMKRDIQIKLKAVSADHCSIAYTGDKGWTITERGKDRLSSNGTFIFMKSMQQMNDHVPSDMIPLHDEMIISFVNYELKVSLLQKTAEEIKEQQAGMNDFFAKLGQSAPAPSPLRSTPAEASMAAEPKYTAEVQPNVAPSQEVEAQPEQPAASEVPKEEESKQADAGAADEQAKPDAADGEVKEATEEEMAAAATKISSVYKGNKDREMVKELKA
jgi:pSer/pThr/pTyr-binding forkhead associated (FHA) protein